ncbi:sulfite dehydrogenase [Marinobacter salinisoli]|uniref:Sulfite dehydrogenase n=1 Tax=Marinobacter salinisoli TaxID=2769486 RepID=A0ABX7MNN0_9GAMM|nr:sulfite dehydrogenase [Marinobacter salinisoli]QSP93882.1 sulfite dehydrogenase [Marinobacter salinisoli]
MFGKLRRLSLDVSKTALEESQKLPSSERRQFLRSGLFTAGGAMVGGALAGLAPGALAKSKYPPENPSWTLSLGPGVVADPYGMPSPFESEVIRRNVPWLTADKVSSISFTPLQHLKGIITPNGLFFERHHAGRPEVDPQQHRLMIHGLVERPIILSMADLQRLPSVSQINFIECPANGGMEWRGAQLNSLQFLHGMVSCAEWTGVRLSTLLQEVGMKPEGKWVLAEGADGAAMTRSIPMAKALDDVIVAYAQNGEALRREQGYPIRLVVPGWEGNTHVKWLRRLEVGDKPWMQREETSKYTDLMADGSARGFTWVMEAKSVITSPCPEMPLGQKGVYQIEGLAWSGNGKVKAVDVSVDGGMNWQQAPLREPVLSKSLTRFALEWAWDGNPALLQSRVIDETGYVQPTLHQLRKARGSNSIYHKNAIQTWKVNADGSVINVQLS